MEQTPIYWLSKEDPEWDAAWSTFPDPAMLNGGEALQYLGTIAMPQGEYVHEFRHRMEPGTNQRRYWNIPCTPGGQPRDIVMQQHLARLGAYERQFFPGQNCQNTKNSRGAAGKGGLVFLFFLTLKGKFHFDGKEPGYHEREQTDTPRPQQPANYAGD